MKTKTTYEEYKKTASWKIIQKSIHALIKNNDLKLLTPEENVIGYLCKKLTEKIKK